MGTVTPIKPGVSGEDPKHVPPREPHGQCDWGGCDEQAVAWRWDDNLGCWLEVCERCKRLD